MLHVLWMCIIGLVAGTLAKLVTPGKDPGGIVVTMLLGIAGSLVAGYLGRALGWYQAGHRLSGDEALSRVSGTGEAACGAPRPTVVWAGESCRQWWCAVQRLAGREVNTRLRAGQKSRQSRPGCL